MERHSSGDNFLLRLNDEAWVTLKDAYLIEATTYNWKYVMNDVEPQPSIQFCGMQHFPTRICEREIHGQLTTPFYSGQVSLVINGAEFETYIYTDIRKITQEQYHLMLSEILQEASLCFEHSGIEMGIDADDRSRELSLAQWSYIEASFSSLATMIRQVIEYPVRELQAHEKQMRRDHVKVVDARTIVWVERNRGLSPDGTIPERVKSTIREESYNTYENRLLKRQLLELRHLLKCYGNISQTEFSIRAEVFVDKLSYWLRDPFFQQVTPYQGVIRISQVFRKHPVYRQCYQWFERLYKNDKERIGMSYNYPLRETFVLYEIWCYMRLVKLFREKGLLKDSSGLFRTRREGVFLQFAEHKESVVQLNNGMRLSYQRVFQNNSPHIYTYTQRMVPDIVIEAGDRLYILDPKYRVASNLGTALGEMHKYKDGILLRRNDDRAVKSTVILTPVQSDEIRFFTADFHDRYNMGAIALTPGVDMSFLSEWIDRLVEEEVECVNF